MCCPLPNSLIKFAFRSDGAEIQQGEWGNPEYDVMRLEDLSDEEDESDEDDQQAEAEATAATPHFHPSRWLYCIPCAVQLRLHQQACSCATPRRADAFWEADMMCSRCSEVVAARADTGGMFCAACGGVSVGRAAFEQFVALYGAEEDGSQQGVEDGSQQGVKQGGDANNDASSDADSEAVSDDSPPPLELFCAPCGAMLLSNYDQQICTCYGEDDADWFWSEGDRCAKCKDVLEARTAVGGLYCEECDGAYLNLRSREFSDDEYQDEDEDDGSDGGREELMDVDDGVVGL